MKWILLIVTAVGAFVGAMLLFPSLPANPVDRADSPMDALDPRGGDVSGRARVIDGDTMDVDGMRVRLHGVDAPEGNQSCLIGDEPWPCGRRSARALADLIDGRVVACQERDRDRYGRIVAVCRRDALDVNAWLVAEGWALAYRRYSVAYVEQESQARQSRRGMWRGDFVSPWNWRQGKRLRPSLREPRIATAPSERQQGGLCRIKGNISRSSGKRIYHMPGDRDYAPTRISLERGERWFCSESEARSAGWRRPRE